MQKLRPNLAGVLLMLPLAVVLSLPRFVTTFSPEGLVMEHLELGPLTWFRADATGDWELSAIVIPLALGWYLLPTLIGALLMQRARWLLAPRWMLAFAATPVLAVATAVVFSYSYWGYAWALPDLDSRVHSVRWIAVSGFESREDGSAWTLQTRDRLSAHRTEEARDFECCVDGRILNVTGLLSDLRAAELAAVETEILAHVPLQSGDEGYAFARRLHGVVAVGEDEHQQPIAFASFTGGEVSNDHYPMYEVLIRRAPHVEVLSTRRYYGDVAGIEVLSAGVVTLTLCAVGVVLTPILLVLVGLLGSLRPRAASA